MQDSNVPAKYPVLFASSAPAGNVTSPIPATAQSNGLVSFPTGWQQINFTPLAAGGVPPWGKDFNGLFNVVTAWQQWAQAGGPIFYDAAFSAAIGGYPKWAMLANAATVGLFWISLVDNNTTDPDAGGANWLPFPTSSPFGPNPLGIICGGYMTATSPTNLQFARNANVGGLAVPISGVFQTIPASPPVISNAGLAASTFYYVYVWMNGATMTLQISTTGPVYGPNGVQVLNGDTTRTFLGWLQTNASGQFVPYVAQGQNILIVNLFNPVPLTAYSASFGSAPGFQEIDSTKRLSFISNGGAAFGLATGEQFSDTNGSGGSVVLFMDGGQWTSVAGGGQNPTAGLNMTTTAFGNLAMPIGYHQLATFGIPIGGGTPTYNVATTLTVMG
jgi:hypothetical protein